MGIVEKNAVMHFFTFASKPRGRGGSLFGTPKHVYSIPSFFLGTQSCFRRLYEEPIVRGQQPDANSEEKLLGQTRAAEVNSLPRPTPVHLVK